MSLSGLGQEATDITVELCRGVSLESELGSELGSLCGINEF